MPMSWSSRWIGSGLVVALVAVAGCGSTASSTHVGAPLDLARAEQAVSSVKEIETHMTMTLTAQGTSSPAVDMTFTSDGVQNRMAMVSKANSSAHVPETELRAAGTDVYTRAGGSGEWTRLTLDPSLVPSMRKQQDPKQLLEQYAAMGVTLRADGTITEGGRTLKRFRGPLDWKKLVRWLSSSSELGKQLFEGGSSQNVSGSAEVMLDAAGFPRRMTMHIDFSAKGKTFSMDEVATTKPLPADSRIDLPDPSEVGKTIPVHDAAGYKKALGDVMGSTGN